MAGYARQYPFVQALDSRAGRLTRPRSGLVAFIALALALAIAWRLPAALGALARHPALAAAEMVTLVAAGTGIWFEIASPRPGPDQPQLPARAAMATAAMWTIWALAYLTGMSGPSWFAAYHDGGPGGLSAAADQQITAAILWAVPASCFLPAVYVTVTAWLSGSAGSAERDLPAASGTAPASWPRPPRAWRSPRTW